MRVQQVTAFVIAAGVAAMVAPLTAQSPAQPPPTFRAGTELVEVDVVAHGRNGAFVADLSADDFVVEEGGVPQKIEQFFIRTVNGTSVPGAPADTNVVADAAPRIFIVVFDDAHLTPAGFKRVQSAAQMLISRHFRSGRDLGGIVTHGRMLNDRLTANRDDLVKAIKDAKPDSSKSTRLLDEQSFPRMSEIEAVRIVFNADRAVLDDVKRRACVDERDYCDNLDPEPPVRAKASQLAETAQAESARTLQILSSLVRAVADVEGRKTILLLSEGFIVEDSWPLVQDVVSLSARANARLYTLDARGTNRGMDGIVARGTDSLDSNARLLAQMDFGADPLNSLAVDTGGFAVRNANQFDAAVSRIADDVDNYYVLGYRPAVGADGKFHAIRVRVKRAGVAIRARRGYVALPRAVLASADAPAVPATAAAPAADTPPPPTPAPAPISTAAGTVITPSEATAPARRARPDAAANAKRLALPSATDADAKAGWDAYQRGDVETARARLSVAAGRPGAEPWIHYMLGMSSYALGQYADAAASWERVRTSQADFEPVYFDLIDAYLQLKEQDKATRVGRTALDRWPTDPELLNAIGVVHTTRGSLDEAIKLFESATAIAPGDSTAYFNLGKAYELRYFRSRRYVDQLRRWVANENDRDEAIRLYRRYLELGGEYKDAANQSLTRLNWSPRAK